MSSISVEIITVSRSTISDRSENDRLRGRHYLDKPVTKWKYWKRKTVYYFPPHLGCMKGFFLNFSNQTIFLFFSVTQTLKCARANGQEIPHSSCQQKRNAVRSQGSRIYQYSFPFLGCSDLLLASPPNRARSGPLVLASCLLTILVALMVVYGKSRQHISPFTVCMCVTFIWFWCW